ncbi:MAG: methionyl-tRNA formyltransferase [Bacteroidota bacterium]
MDIIFMGTPEFAVPSLSILFDHGYTIKAVVTATDKPRGRGHEISFTPVKKFAVEHSLPVLQPDTLREPSFVKTVHQLAPDCIAVVGFRILPPEIFTIPKLGAFNLHASLLPKYRGAAPIQWALINGERETGVTTFFLQEKIDTGNVILQARINVGENETAGELYDRLMILGAETVLSTIRLIEQGKTNPQPQDEKDATPAPKIFREQCAIDWTKPVQQVHNFIRGLSPIPGAFTHHTGKSLKIYRSRIFSEEGTGIPGRIVVENEFIKVFTGKGVLEVLELQQEGKKRLHTNEFLKGYRFGDNLRFL